VWGSLIKIPWNRYLCASDLSLGDHQIGNRRSPRIIALLISLILVLILGWIFIRPGVFTIQPIEALPEGITYIYHSRGTEIPFFSSPEGLCLKTRGGVDIFCRTAALEGSAELAERIFVRLPYNHWAYLRSTGGIEFDR